MGEKRVCLGVVAAPHGVRGLVKVKSFTEDPEKLASYGPLSDEAGSRRFDLEVLGRSGGLLLVRLQGVGDRDQAAALRGSKLFVDRSALPAPEDEEEFYHADLMGLLAVSADGEEIGRVKAVQNHGAGDFLVLRCKDGRDLELPFTRAVVPQVDLPGGRLIVALPNEVEAGEGAEGGD